MLLAAVVVALLGGCGGAEEAVAPDTTETTIGPTDADTESRGAAPSSEGGDEEAAGDPGTNAPPEPAEDDPAPGTDGPMEPGPLAPGEHTTSLFTPTVSFTLDEGWAAPYIEEVDNFALWYEDRGSAAFVEVLRPQGVLSNHFPEGPGPADADVAPLPDDLVQWLRGIPYLETSEPEPVTVGGYEGVRMTVTVEDLPDDARRPWCPEPTGCVGLFPVEASGGFIGEDASRNPTEYIILDVEGEPVVVTTGARIARPSGSGDDAQELRARADAVLGTFAFASAPDDGSCRDDQVDLNTATAAELQRIVHIEGGRAVWIIQGRPWGSIEHLRHVEGIGEEGVADIVAQDVACIGE